MNIPSFILLILFPLLACPVIYLIGYADKQGNRKVAYWVGFITTLATWVPFVLSVQDFLANQGLSFTYGTITMQMDAVSLLLAGSVLVLGTLVMLYSGPYMSKTKNENKYYALVSSLLGVMIGLGFTTDVFNLWVWFEGMAISTYLLVAYYHDHTTSLEAGIKYLVQSAAGSALVLVGNSIILGITGTLSLPEVTNQAAAGNPILISAGILMIIGFGVKAALVPMHTWLPDAHSQAPSGISALLSGVVIEAGLVAMLRVISALADVSTLWGPILMGFSAVNMMVGNLMALRQTEVKRLLAYSSLAHVGYMLLGFAMTFYASDGTGAQGAFFHLFNHAMMKGLAFLAVGVLLYSLYVSKGSHKSLTLDDLNGAFNKYPLVALSLTFALLGLGGVPPLAGFLSKWQIFVAGVDVHNGWITALVIFAGVNSVLSLGYYAPMINRLYKNEQSESVLEGGKAPVLMVIPLMIMALAILAIGFWPGLVTWLTDSAGPALLVAFGG